MPKIRINNPIQFATTPLGSRSEYLDLLEKKYDIKKFVCIEIPCITKSSSHSAIFANSTKDTRSFLIPFVRFFFICTCFRATVTLHMALKQAQIILSKQYDRT